MLRTRFIVLLVVLCAGFVAALTAWQAVRQDQLDRMLKETKIQQSSAAREVIELESTGLDTIAHDYTYWDDIVNFVGHPTKKFADENFVPSFTTYGYDAYWVYDTKGRLVWKGTKEGMEAIGDPWLGSESLPVALSKDKLRRFFSSSPLGVVELRASTINRTNDPQKVGPTFGYLVVAMVWDSDWIAKIRHIINSRVEILGPNAKLSNIPDSNELDTLESLTDLDGKPVAKMYISSMSASVRALDYGNKSEAQWVIVFVVSILGLVSWCLAKWVTGPLSQITRSLQSGNTDLLLPLKGKQTEFGKLASVVDGFFAQKSSLEAEVRHRKRAQTELLKIRKAVDSASDSITIADTQGTVIYVNLAYSELFGYSAEEVNRMGGFGSLLGDELKTAVREKVLNGQIWDGEATVKCKQGELIPISWRTTAVRDSRGHIIGMISVITDVREKHRMQRRMLQAEKLAALGELMAGIAHEINNPLAAISGHAQLLEHNSDPSVRSDAKSIRKMAERAHRIIGSMLTFSRDNTIAKRHCSLRVPIESALDMCDYRLKKRGIRLEINLSDEDPCATINDQQIQQIVLNLLNNAEHAVRENDPDDRVIGLWSGITIAEDGSRRATIRVADNGAGMDAETQKCVFDPFFTTKDVGDGTGLGLSICHRIVNDHQGTIEVTSSPGQGTMFEVSFAESKPEEKAA